MGDIERLLLLVEKTLPERLTLSYNANRPRGAPERDFESLRRKLKVLYGTRKPTGVPDMPLHIKKAKEVSVVELDDGVDDDQRSIEPDFWFEVDPDDTFYEDDEGEDLPAPADPGAAGPEHRRESSVTYGSGDTELAISGRSPSRGGFQELLEAPLSSNELGDITPSSSRATTPRPVPLRSSSNRRRTGSGGLPQPRKTAVNYTGSDAAALTHQPSAQGRTGANRDEREAA
ncbi:hypothetical protein PInf_008155 [Phytophthora infestans]|nr:hypothetical protein PInf_008155 [Phytophthora infestans]